MKKERLVGYVRLLRQKLQVVIREMELKNSSRKRLENAQCNPLMNLVRFIFPY